MSVLREKPLHAFPLCRQEEYERGGHSMGPVLVCPLRHLKNSVSMSETDDENWGILRRDFSLRDDCGLFGPWSGDIVQGHLYLDRIR